MICLRGETGNEKGANNSLVHSSGGRRHRWRDLGIRAWPVPCLRGCLEIDQAARPTACQRMDRTIQIAATVEMDVNAAFDRFKSTDIFGILNQGRTEVRAVGIEGMPKYFVNQKRLTDFSSRQFTGLVKKKVQNAKTQTI